MSYEMYCDDEAYEMYDDEAYEMYDDDEAYEMFDDEAHEMYDVYDVQIVACYEYIYTSMYCMSTVLTDFCMLTCELYFILRCSMQTCELYVLHLNVQ